MLPMTKNYYRISFDFIMFSLFLRIFALFLIYEGVLHCSYAPCKYFVHQVREGRMHIFCRVIC